MVTGPQSTADVGIADVACVCGLRMESSARVLTGFLHWLMWLLWLRGSYSLQVIDLAACDPVTVFVKNVPTNTSTDFRRLLLSSSLYTKPQYRALGARVPT